MDPFVTLVALIGIVVVVASLLSGALERSRLPIVAVFLGLGVLLGPWGLAWVDIGFGSPELHALATLALALVLFSDAVTFDTRVFKTRRQLLLRLLGPGTLLPAALIALAAWMLLGVPAPAAAILGAALASTDPVLLRSVVRSRSLPETSRIALRMETGMNDIVLLPIVVVAILVLGQSPTHGGARPDLMRSIVGLFLLGPAFGALVGWVGIFALSWVRRRFTVRRDYESLYALGLAFTAYAAAEAVGGSGFVAAFVAGLMVAAQDVELCDCFLEYGEATAEILLLLTFVALGTTLIWTGLDVIDWRTLLFAGVALTVRTVVLYPVLGGVGLDRKDRKLIALLGPRGLSTLLLTLLPVFAGVAGAERLFAISCLVVLISVVLHGALIAYLLRAEPMAPTSAAPQSRADAMGHAPESATARRGSEEVPLGITLDELRAVQARGEPTVIVDSRTDKSYESETLEAAGAVRVRPDDPVRDVTALEIPRNATLAIYCS